MKSFVLCALLGLSVSAHAQTSTTTLSVPSSTQTASEGASAAQTSTVKIGDVLSNKKFEDDKDITDSKLKADSGSLSRYSLKFNLSYNGPPVGDLNNTMQPNPDGSVGTFETALGGSISARYRIDTKSAIGFGTGASALTPVQGVKRYDVKNPFITYDRNARVYEMQMRNSVGVTFVTNPEYRAIGEYAGLNYDNSMIYNIGASGLGVGVDTSLSYYLYERQPDASKSKEMKSGRYNLSFFPQVKYNFSDRLNAYTSLAINFINPRGTEDHSVLWNRTLSQRLGMGYAFTRDIYFAPYLNFYPKSAEMDSTTINFSTTFSIL
ncbi:hypothetical protein [Bdellovibrio svalbardensis]|uniref:DUF481 domain-containing protein n=1 Tax=Bdellovibrio svalbardensis TaxID=2972972 RepID=A0ABT6DJE0_9BACT|nr:hypothetical protein [Bdellovibrio svalbardensis]MDG0816891.1 hypothetical protein [Bdellovibrio svalbardensis]